MSVQKNLKNEPTSEKRLSKKPSTKLGKSLNIDPFNFEEKSSKSFKINEEYFKKKECTSLTLGPEKIIQECYICPNCSINKTNYICKYCYENCHINCRKSEDLILVKNNNNNNYLNQKEFSCYCGIKLKHKPNNKMRNDIIVCNLMELDIALQIDHFYCENHEINICCICSISCHKNCQVTKIKKEESEHKIINCLCVSDNHTSFNELGLSFDLNEYMNLSNIKIWPIQIYNILFNNQNTFNKLVSLFTAVLNVNNNINLNFINNIYNIDIIEINDDMRERFYPLLELFTNIFIPKFKTYYYQNEIIEMFRFENLLIYMHSLEIKDSKFLLLKFRLMFAILFIHLKKDFQMVKSLISNDFLLDNIFGRIYYKKLLSKKTIYTSGIDLKYNIESLLQENNIIKNIIVNNICKLLEVGMDFVSIEDKQIEFEICLKLISYMLKKMIFTNNELKNLINSLYQFFTKFYEYINEDKTNIYSLFNIFNILSKIFYMITICYNDNSVMDYLDFNKDIEKIKNLFEIKSFIHLRSEHGNLLFKMVLKSCDFLKKHYLLIQKNEELIIEEKKKFDEKIQLIDGKIKYKLPEKGGLFQEKIILLFNETIKIFSLADNIYYKQIEKLNKDDIIEYYFFVDKIKNDNYKILKPNEIQQLHGLLYNLKLGIETKLTGLFTSSYSDENININTKIHQSILYFSDMLRQLFLTKELESDIIKDDKNRINNRYFKYERYGKDIKLNEGHLFKNDGKKLKDYIIKLAMNVSNYFYIFNNFSFHRYLEDFIDSLIISNIDETISKVSIFLSDRKFHNLLTYSLLDMILIIFSLFFFNKRGFKYFLMGKNLSRINKIFNRFYLKANGKNNDEKKGKDIEGNLKKINRLLKFLLLMIKGLNLYNIPLKYHKMLLRLKKNLLEHIEEFNKLLKEKNELEEEFKIQFTFIMKIFKKLQNHYEYEEFEEIKHRIILIFYNSNSNLLEAKKFTTFFPVQKEEDKKEEDKNEEDKNEEEKEEEDKKEEENKEEEISTNKKKKGSKLNLKENSEAESNVNTIQKDDIILEEDIYEKKITLELYFAFFDLISTNSYYHFNTEDDINVYNKLYNFNDFIVYKRLFNSNSISLKNKTKILKFLRSIYFIDKLDYYNFLEQNKQLTTLDFIKLVQGKLFEEKKLNSQIDLSEFKEDKKNILNVIQNKFNIINQLDQVIHLYISELKKFPMQLKGNKIDYCLKMFKELLLGTKFIGNFFYFEKEIWSKVNISSYELLIEFIPKVEVFKKIYQEIIERKDNKILDMNFDEFENLNENNLYIHSDNYEKEEKLLNLKIILDKLHSTSFNLYNKKEIFKYYSEGFNEVCLYTNFNNNYNLNTFLEKFDMNSKTNFTPFSLIKTLDYEYFYDEDNLKNENVNYDDDDIDNYKIYALKKSFVDTFLDINNTNFFNVFTRVSNETIAIDYRKKIVEYFQIFLNSKEGNNSQKLEDLFCIITKLIFYDCENMQKRFEYLINDKYFFPNLNKILNYYIVLTFSLYKNIYAFDRSLKIGNITKLIIQFLQTLGENFNSFFHDNIFKFQEDIPIKEKKFEEKNNEEQMKDGLDLKDKKENEIDNRDNNDNNDNNNIDGNDDNKTVKTGNSKKKKKKKKDKFDSFKNISKSIPEVKIKYRIYESIINNLKRSYFFLDIEDLIDSELPYDKLVILTSNFIDFLIEYIETTNGNNEILNKYIKYLFFGKKVTEQKNVYEILDYKPVLNVLFVQLKNDDIKNEKLYLLRKKILCYIKIKYAELLTSYLQVGKKDKFINKLLILKCTPIELFQEILYNFKELLENLKRKDEKLYNSLMKINNTKKYVKKLIFYYTYESTFRNIIELSLCFKLYILIKIYEDIYGNYSLRNHFNKLNIEKINYDDIDKFGIRSTFGKRIYLFLEKIVLQVEIKKPEKIEIEEEENKGKNEEKNIEKITNNVLKRFNIKNDENENKIKIYKNEDDEEIYYKNDNLIAFFIRPYITFSLSNNSRNYFENNVDRANATTKFNYLLFYSDYCLFEMISNLKRIGKNQFKSNLLDFNFNLMEIINYLVILIQNALLMYHYYISANVDDSIYDVKDNDLKYHLFFTNTVLSLIQIIFLLICLIIWFFFRFFNCYQMNLMKENNQNFIFRKKNQDNKISNEVIDLFNENKDISISKVQSTINKSIPITRKLFTLIIYSILINREVNILLFSLILTSLYLATKSTLFLVFQTIFIINIIPTLFNIYKVMLMKIIYILIILIFEFFIVYIFMWFSYFYFSDLFTFNDVIDRNSQDNIYDSFCYSSVQCLLFIIQKGITSRKGIGEVINKVSFYSDYLFFLKKFFYDMLFWIIIILILGNIFLGIIINAFGELRKKNSNLEDDKNNICFICQLSKDECLFRNIDFDNHIKGIHNLWNYVYFLVYLHINNSNEFNSVENLVWNKLDDNDFSWIPIQKSDD